MKNQWLERVAWFGDLFLEGEIKGVVLWFHGLNGCCRLSKSAVPPWEIETASRGGLVVYPNYNPWSFMCRNDRAFLDRLIPAVYEEFGLDGDVPLISAGQSMGGGSALLYCRYGKKKPAACLALSPLCDPEKYYSEFTPDRPSAAAALHNMFDAYPEPFEACLAEHSPLRQAEFMPDIPYLFLHSDGDAVVSKSHSDQMTAALRKFGRKVEYREQKHLEHVAVSLADELAMADFVSKHFKGNNGK